MDGVARTKKKWGEVATAAGFTVLPNHLLSINQFMPKERQLTPTEMIVLIQILISWWSADRMPFPSKLTIALRAGLSPRQVQRALAGLEYKKLVGRIARSNISGGRASNEYDLTGLVNAVVKIAEANQEAFKRQKREL